MKWSRCSEDFHFYQRNDAYQNDDNDEDILKNFFLSGGDDVYQDNEDKICEDFLPIKRDEWGWGSWQTAWAPDWGPSFDHDNDDNFEGVDDIETLWLSIPIIWWISSFA